MRLTILGSGSATPQPGRASAGYLLETDRPLLFDFGAGTLATLVRTHVPLHQLEHLFVTHLHADHVADFIPYFFSEVFASREHSRKSLHLYGPTGSEQFFMGLLELFPSFREGTFSTHVTELGMAGLTIGQTTIRSHPVPHSESIPSIAYRVDYQGRSFVYSGDLRDGAPLVTLCRGADLAVIEATFREGRPRQGHLTAAAACDIAEAAGVRRLVLTHFEPGWAGQELPPNCHARFSGDVLLATDGMQIEL